MKILLKFWLPACAGLALFLLYDLWSVRPGGRRWPKALFWLGFLCWAKSTAHMLARGLPTAAGSPVRAVALGLLGLAFLALLAYSLFFALPKGTYSDPAAPRGAYSDGIYALCRPPGVLWFVLFYLCLYGALPCAATLWGGAWLCGANLVYVLFQDVYTFPRTFYDYKEYRLTTPFLLPNPASVRRALHTLADEEHPS